MFWVFRAVEGFGATYMTPTSQTLVTNAFPTSSTKENNDV